MSKTVKDTLQTRGKMRGFLGTLTEEQRAALKAYRGPDGVKPMADKPPEKRSGRGSAGEARPPRSS